MQVSIRVAKCCQIRQRLISPCDVSHLALRKAQFQRIHLRDGLRDSVNSPLKNLTPEIEQKQKRHGKHGEPPMYHDVALKAHTRPQNMFHAMLGRSWNSLVDTCLCVGHCRSRMDQVWLPLHVSPYSLCFPSFVCLICWIWTRNIPKLRGENSLTVFARIWAFKFLTWPKSNEQLVKIRENPTKIQDRAGRKMKNTSSIMHLFPSSCITMHRLRIDYA